MIKQITMEELTQNETKLNRMHDELSITTRLHLDQYLNSLKPSTRLIYRSTLINFLYRLKSSNPLVLRQYNLSMWEQYVRDYFSSFSAKTINNKTHAVKSFFDYLVSIGERKNNPLDEYQLLKESKGNESRNNLSWKEINMLKRTIKDKLFEVFEWGYIEGKKISETGRNGSYVDYYAKMLGKQIGIDNLKYSDLTATRKRYFATCPITGQELEMTEENWTFKDGLLQAKVNKTNNEE